MSLAVLLYQFVTNELHVPDDWPAEVRTLEENEIVESPWLEMTEGEYQTYITNPDRVQRKTDWNIHHADPNMAIVITDVVCTEEVEEIKAHAMFSYNDTGDITKVRAAENKDFKVTIEVRNLQTNEIVTAFNALYAMPLEKEGGSTILLGVNIVNGRSEINLNLTAGLYSVTEEIINRDLVTNHFAFKQVNLYIMKCVCGDS